MKYKERIELYLSGNMDDEEKFQTEREMLEDGGLMEEYINASEQAMQTAPPDFTAAVMRNLFADEAAPAFSRKMRAAVCFCSAAAILVFTVSGLDRMILEFITSNYGKFNEFLATIKTF